MQTPLLEIMGHSSRSSCRSRPKSHASIHGMLSRVPGSSAPNGSSRRRTFGCRQPPAPMPAVAACRPIARRDTANSAEPIPLLRAVPGLSPGPSRFAAPTDGQANGFAPARTAKRTSLQDRQVLKDQNSAEIRHPRSASGSPGDLVHRADLPFVGLSCPMSMRRKVLFPHPRPTRETNAPETMSRFTRSRMIRSPYSFQRFLTVIAVTTNLLLERSREPAGH